jgi:hypothetical protein
MRESSTTVAGGAFGLLLLLCAASAQAGLLPAKPLTFDFIFEGRSARAVGFVTVDANLLPNPAACSYPDPLAESDRSRLSGHGERRHRR